MAFLRVLILVLIVWLVWRMLMRRLLGPRQKTQGAQGPARIGKMVRCEVCGLHVPVEESVSDGEHHFCGEAHRLDAGRRGE